MMYCQTELLKGKKKNVLLSAVSSKLLYFLSKKPFMQQGKKLPGKTTPRLYLTPSNVYLKAKKWS